ncbi:hypothetical protein ES703_114416 [subsurface metagenome]
MNLTFPIGHELYLKTIETAKNLDKFLSIDLAPYEINVLVEGTATTLSIRNNKVISLDDSETIYLRKTAEEVLHETKNKIKQVLWEFRLKFPFDVKEDLED